MSWVFAVLLAAAVLVLIGAEWPRLAPRTRAFRPRERQRARRRRQLTLVSPSDDDDFAASVERDLSQLPTIEERDRRTHS